jgi:hypothetical protein
MAMVSRDAKRSAFGNSRHLLPSQEGIGDADRFAPGEGWTLSLWLRPADGVKTVFKSGGESL